MNSYEGRLIVGEHRWKRGAYEISKRKEETKENR